MHMVLLAKSWMRKPSALIWAMTARLAAISAQTRTATRALIALSCAFRSALVIAIPLSSGDCHVANAEQLGDFS
jgi:phage tail protein X